MPTALPSSDHPSHFGYLCPVETPEGPACGLITGAARNAWPGAPRQSVCARFTGHTTAHAVGLCGMEATRDGPRHDGGGRRDVLRVSERRHRRSRVGCAGHRAADSDVPVARGGPARSGDGVPLSQRRQRLHFHGRWARGAAAVGRRLRAGRAPRGRGRLPRRAADVPPRAAQSKRCWIAGRCGTWTPARSGPSASRCCRRWRNSDRSIWSRCTPI